MSFKCSNTEHCTHSQAANPCSTCWFLSLWSVISWSCCLRRRPGTNRYNFEVANWRREQLQQSHAVMCRQIESVQRRLKQCDRASSYDTASDSLIQNPPGILQWVRARTGVDVWVWSPTWTGFLSLLSPQRHFYILKAHQCQLMWCVVSFMCSGSFCKSGLMTLRETFKRFTGKYHWQ